MEIKDLKNYLLENQDKLQLVLEDCGFHGIKFHHGNPDNYLTFGNPDGDNHNAVTIYLNPSLLTINYTRDICSSKNNCDFIDLIMWIREEDLFKTLQYISEISELNYYHKFNDDEPESLKILKQIQALVNLNRNSNKDDEDNTPIQPKDEVILSYYMPYCNQMFADDGIPFSVQREFEIGYDSNTNYITIPIRDEIGTLCGIKGRFCEREVSNDYKYLYLERFPKGKILYGYFKSKDFIKNSSYTLIGESEKSMLQMWSMGYKNCLATGGTKVSRPQIDKLSRLGKRIVLAFDKDFSEDKIQNLRNKFSEFVDFWAIIDKDNILDEKESPSDNREKFKVLLSNNVYKIEKTENIE